MSKTIEEVPVRAGPSVSEDGMKIFVASQPGTLHALDTTDGYELWTDDNEAQLYTSPIVSGDVVYQAMLYGQYHVKAVQVENGREVWVYPPPEAE